MALPSFDITQHYKLQRVAWGRGETAFGCSSSLLNMVMLSQNSPSESLWIEGGILPDPLKKNSTTGYHYTQRVKSLPLVSSINDLTSSQSRIPPIVPTKLRTCPTLRSHHLPYLSWFRMISGSWRLNTSREGETVWTM